MKNVKKITRGVSVVISLILIAILGYKFVMTIAVPNKIPTFFGYSNALVVSGSMEPTLSTGDMVICKAQDSYEINDVIAYYDEQDDVFILHRIIGNSVDGFFTQGDFNSINDPVPVKLENIQGKVVLAIPNMKTYRDMLCGAVLVLFIEYIIKIVIVCRKAKSEKGGKKVDEKE